MKKSLKSTIKLGVATLVVGIFGSSAIAQSVDYNYLEGRFVNDNASRGVNANSGNGLELSGSFQVSSNWLAFGSYRSQDYGAFDYTNLEIGGAMILRGIIDHDLIATTALIKREYSFNSASSSSDTGIRVSAGMRDFFFKKYLPDVDLIQPIELRGFVNVENVGDFDAYLELGADYHFYSSFSAGLQIEVGGDAQAISAGIRWYY